MIKLKNLTKMFGQQTVVNAASTQFEKGKVTSIIGPNGAGKSTLLSMASRLINRDAGEVWIDNRELVDWDTKALAKKLSVLRQANSLTMRFTVRELVSFGRLDDQQVIDQSIEYLDLSDIEHKYLDELSGGQRQLAFIAMVIAQDTDYVFLDEPLNNLDIKHSLQIMSTIQRLAHELDKAGYSDRIIAMKKGEMVASGSVEEVIQAQVLSNIYETPFRVVEMEGKLMCLYHT